MGSAAVAIGTGNSEEDPLPKSQSAQQDADLQVSGEDKEDFGFVSYFQCGG